VNSPATALTVSQLPERPVMRSLRQTASRRFTQAAASGQPPRKSDIYAYCWTTSFPALAETLRHVRHCGQACYWRVVTRLRFMVQTWDDTLRASGYRVTPQRQLVLEAVARLEHATPEDIYAEVQQTARGVNVSTVYRTLELLEQLGLVTHSHLHHGAPTYHLAQEAQHVHLVCRRCEQITEVDQAVVNPLVGALDQQHGFLTDVGHLTVFGLCANCRS
jgi:Fur family ferric uptake transcriptional regulator